MRTVNFPHLRIELWSVLVQAFVSFFFFAKNVGNAYFKAILIRIESEVLRAVWAVGKGETGYQMPNFEDIEQRY